MAHGDAAEFHVLCLPRPQIESHRCYKRRHFPEKDVTSFVRKHAIAQRVSLADEVVHAGDEFFFSGFDVNGVQGIAPEDVQRLSVVRKQGVLPAVIAVCFLHVVPFGKLEQIQAVGIHAEDIPRRVPLEKPLGVE